MATFLTTDMSVEQYSTFQSNIGSILNGVESVGSSVNDVAGKIANDISTL